MSFETEVRTARFMVGLLAIIGLIIAFNPFDTIFDMGKMAFSGLAVLFPIALIAVRYQFKRPIFGVLAIVISISLLFAFHYGWIPKDICLGFESFILLIAISFGISMIGIGKKELR